MLAVSALPPPLFVKYIASGAIQMCEKVRSGRERHSFPFLLSFRCLFGVAHSFAEFMRSLSPFKTGAKVERANAVSGHQTHSTNSSATPPSPHFTKSRIVGTTKFDTKCLSLRLSYYSIVPRSGYRHSFGNLLSSDVTLSDWNCTSAHY